jgi:hypothetical protein
MQDTCNFNMKKIFESGIHMHFQELNQSNELNEHLKSTKLATC